MKRKNEIKVRFTDKEIADVNRKTALSGLSREEFIRKTLAGKRVTELPPVEYGKLIFEMRRAGQNVSQLLKTARANHYLNVADMRECVDEIRAVERKIHDSFFAPKPEE